MKTSFSDLLSEIISQSEISKNEMIRACDIDRSSFFKFLNGSRIPTAQQLNRICSKLQFSPQEEKALRLEYAKITQGESNVRSGTRIADLLWKLEEASSAESAWEMQYLDGTGFEEEGVFVTGKEKVLKLLMDTFARGVESGETIFEADLFLPARTETFIRWLIGFLLSRSGDGVRIRQIIELPSRDLGTDRMSMDWIRFALLCTAASPDSYSGYYYYSYHPSETKMGALYAYSVITQQRVILLDERMDKAVVVQDERFCSDYRNHFVSLLNSTKPFVRKVDACDVAKELKDPICYRYGLGRMLTKGLSGHEVVYASPAGLREFMQAGEWDEEDKCGSQSRKGRQGEEKGLNKEAVPGEESAGSEAENLGKESTGSEAENLGKESAGSEAESLGKENSGSEAAYRSRENRFRLEERQKKIRAVGEKLGTRLFLIDERNLPPARNWSIMLSGSEKVLLYRQGCRYYFVVAESGIVNAFHSFLKELPNSGNLLRNELAREVFDSFLGSLPTGKAAKK